MKVLVIGNGFDIANGLKTTWNDFKIFLLNKDKKLHDFLDNIFNDGDWSDFETSLRLKGIDAFNEDIDIIHENAMWSGEQEYDVSEPSTYDNGTYIFRDDMESAVWLPNNINKYMMEWIELNEKDDGSLIDINLNYYDHIISFNYTSYFINKYNYEGSVTHVHGSLIDGDVKVGFTEEIKEVGNVLGRFAYDKIDKTVYLKDFNKSNWGTFDLIDGKSINDITFFGLSFGEEDRKYIDNFTKQGCKKITIYERSEEKFKKKSIKLKDIYKLDDIEYKRILIKKPN